MYGRANEISNSLQSVVVFVRFLTVVNYELPKKICGVPKYLT